MEVRNILLGCPNLTIFWLYRDRSNVQSWNMAYSLLWIIILWAVICTEILGRELIYQLTSLLFKNRDKYVPPNCHCLAARSVTHCHMFPSRAQTPHTLFHSNCADFKSILVFSAMSLYWSAFHFRKARSHPPGSTWESRCSLPLELDWALAYGSGLQVAATALIWRALVRMEWHSTCSCKTK